MSSVEMTTNDVAEFLEVDPSRVRALRIAGRLHGKRKVGPTWVYDRAEVAGFKRGWNRTSGRRAI